MEVLPAATGAILARVGVTPVKGTRHPALDAVELDASGVLGDRLFCLVDVERRRVLRTVEHPELIGVPARWRDPVLEVDLPAGTIADAPRPTGRHLDADYWGRRPRLELQHSQHAAGFGELLGREVALARVTDRLDVVYGAGVTVVTTTDLAELGDRAGVADLVDQAARFRATLTIEDRERPLRLDPGVRLRVGEAVIELGEPIPRCAVIEHDPVAGRRDGGLLTALAGYRRFAGGIGFGCYADVVAPGRCAVGDDFDRD